jgi:hypothetical protein
MYRCDNKDLSPAGGFGFSATGLSMTHSGRDFHAVHPATRGIERCLVVRQVAWRVFFLQSLKVLVQ